MIRYSNIVDFVYPLRFARACGLPRWFRQVYFAGLGNVAAANETGVTDRMMRRTKWTMFDERRASGELVCDGVDARDIQGFFNGHFRQNAGAGRGLKGFSHCLGFPPSARCAQNAITFHLEFGPDIIENARYDMQTLYSMENLEIANEALGRKKAWHCIK